VATDSPRDITNRNQPLLLFHMDPTNTIVCLGVHGRVSLDLWCHAGLIFSKTWVENQWWIPLKECRHSYQYLRDIMTLDCIHSLNPYLIFGYISLDTRLDLTFTLYELKKTLFR
jgi:hypothetical protein